MKIRNGFVSNSSSSSFIAFVPDEVFDATMAEMPEETRRILSYFPTTEMCRGDQAWHKVIHKKDYESSRINGICVEDEELEAIFPDDFNAGDHRSNWDLMEWITDAMGRFTSALPEDKILYVEEYE
jgi:hypothetical protein